MTGDDDAFEVVGDLSPTELAHRLAWPPRLVRELIDEGAVTRTGAGWLVHTATLSRRWAQAHWDAAIEPPSRPRARQDGES